MIPMYRIRWERPGGAGPEEASERLAGSPPVRQRADGRWESAYICGLGGEQQLELRILEAPEEGVVCLTPVLTNRSPTPMRLHRLDAGAALAGAAFRLRYFTSGWGREFSPEARELDGPYCFGTSAGRCSNGCSPWAGLEGEECALAAALAWSGNWEAEARPDGGGCGLWMGISDWYADLAPGGSFTGAEVVMAEGTDLEEACLRLRRYFRRWLSHAGRPPLLHLPLEYNTWWAYEDKEIDEAVFQQNAGLAGAMGLDAAMMDAGWFGRDEAGAGWEDKRGDWDIVDPRAFPSGMKALCTRAREAGVRPGIWCEIEAIGPKARLGGLHPEWAARREGKPLGYLCFGSPEVRAWAMGVLDRLIGEYGAAWIKFDFNLDPGLGCDEPGHGHGPGNGLIAHYRGYYAFLEELRLKYPGVVLENCASGGQRHDLAVLARTHLGFLSDPDHTEHHLQVFWGALSFVHQSNCLHFAWSDTMGMHNCGVNRAIPDDTPPAKVDYMVRAAMMGVPGFSYRLPELAQVHRDRIRWLAGWYRSISDEFIRDGDAYRLTPQPLRDGGGERYPVFAFVSPGGDALAFAFRLPGAPDSRRVRLFGLEPGALYRVRYEDGGGESLRSGSSLMQEGLCFSGLAEEASEVVRMDRTGAEDAG